MRSSYSKMNCKKNLNELPPLSEILDLEVEKEPGTEPTEDELTTPSVSQTTGVQSSEEVISSQSEEPDKTFH